MFSPAVNLTVWRSWFLKSYLNDQVVGFDVIFRIGQI
jgi:hypothetical protein